MDEILCANYLPSDDVVREADYDLWVGDECWEIDYFLHVNPDRKIAPYVFMTDVIGFLPTDPTPAHVKPSCAPAYNADSVEKRERFPRLRDVSMFIGSFDELPDVPFGPSLPGIRPRSRRWFCSVPCVVPFNPAAYRDRAGLRRRDSAMPRTTRCSWRRWGAPRPRQPAGADLRRVQPAAQGTAGRADDAGHRPADRSPPAA